MKPTTCFAPAHILLPSEQVPLEQWGCIACDQFTSDRSYWQRAEETAAGAPSTLNLILPEVYLEDGDADARVEKIHATMQDYAQNVLTRVVDGFIYVERTEQSGRVRQGLVGRVDLEAYSYRRGEKCTVRPSECTVESRIPPRMKVRTGAALETPHIMMLADDPDCTLIEPIAAHKDSLPKVYEGELMLGGGHVAGWAVEDPALIAQIENALTVLGSQQEIPRCHPPRPADAGRGRRQPLTGHRKGLLGGAEKDPDPGAGRKPPRPLVSGRGVQRALPGHRDRAHPPGAVQRGLRHRTAEPHYMERCQHGRLLLWRQQKAAFYAGGPPHGQCAQL